MAIKENALPLGASSGSGSYIRTVSSGGESQRTPFDVVKGAMNADIETALENEVSAREDADTALRGEITDVVAAEATARDQAIADAIATEVTDRNAAIAEAQGETEQAISAAISGEVTARNQAIASAIQTETAGRTAAIQKAISDEVTDRDAAIASAIESEETDRNTAISEAVAAEAQAREAADEELSQSKANTDGNYPDMTVGNADQLVSSLYTEDQTPYNFRQAGGGLSIGDREIDKVVGGTVAWNQLAKAGDGNQNVATKSYDATTGITTITPTSYSTDNVGCFNIVKTADLVVGHKYLCSVDVNPDHEVAFRYGVPPFVDSPTVSANNWTTLAAVITNAQAASYVVYGKLSNAGWTDGEFRFRQTQCIDLTAMFGSAIADYIYSLEQATAGAGVAYFKKLFPKPYYAYNAGELMSVQAISHEMVGFNQWDEEWELGYISGNTGGPMSDSNAIRTKNYVPCFPNTTYYAKVDGYTGTKRIAYYDANKVFLGASPVGFFALLNGEFTTPANAYYFRFYIGSTNTYNNDICINLSHNGSRNGEYEPYERHSYELDGNQTLRGVPKLDASNNLYYDGDTYASDGTVTRKYGVVDLGTLTWYYITNYDVKLFYATLPSYAIGKGWEMSNGITSKYAQWKAEEKYWLTMSDKNFVLDNVGLSTSNRIYVNDTAYTDAASFKAAMSGVMLVYELATPTEESAAPYTNPQTVSDWGTEEYVDAAVQEGDRDVAVPVGHVTDYLANLRDKLQNLPDAAGADGMYLVQQTSGQMALLAYTPGVNIPAAPTTDGTYTLQAVVSGGVATYSWVSS